MAGFTLGLAGSAEAAEGVDQLGKCSSASEVVSLDDGSTVALGTTDDCGATARPRERVLLKLTQAGGLDTSFGNGGIATLPDVTGPNVVDLLVQSDGKLMLVTDSKVARFKVDGSLDRDYGMDGMIPVGLTGADSLGVDATATSIDDQGRLLVAGTGLLGGFTTFSTHAVESVRLLIGNRRAGLALGNLIGTALGCLALAGIGWWLAS